MPARLSVETDHLRGYGASTAGHADYLHAAAQQLIDLGAFTPPFGPVGAAFVAALTRAVEQESHGVYQLSRNLIAAQHAALRAAQAYDAADDSAAARLAGDR